MSRRMCRSNARNASSPARAQGFTLVEIIVALGVFALVSMAVYSRVGEVVAGTRALEMRTLGTWVARDHLTRLRLEQRGSDAPPALGTDSLMVRMADRDWRLRTEVLATSDPGLRRIEIEVLGADAGGDAETVFAVLTGFVGRT